MRKQKDIRHAANAEGDKKWNLETIILDCG